MMQKFLLMNTLHQMVRNSLLAMKIMIDQYYLGLLDSDLIIIHVEAYMHTPVLFKDNYLSCTLKIFGVHGLSGRGPI